MFILAADLSAQIVLAVKSAGFTDVGPRSMGKMGKVFVLGRNGDFVAVLSAINPGGKGLHDVFDAIHKALEEVKNASGRYPIELLVQGGGTIPIPEDFLDWCRQNGIRVRVLEPEAILHGEIRVG